MPHLISDYLLRSGAQIAPPETPSSDASRPTDDLADSGESAELQSFGPMSSPPSSTRLSSISGSPSPASASGPTMAPMLGRNQTARIREWLPPRGLERGGQWRRTKARRSFAYFHGVRVRDLESEQEKWACAHCIEARVETPAIYSIQSTTHAVEHLRLKHRVGPKGVMIAARPVGAGGLTCRWIDWCASCTLASSQPTRIPAITSALQD